MAQDLNKFLPNAHLKPTRVTQPTKNRMDDDSIMRSLANELDIQSAAMHMRRIGFAYLKPENDEGYHRFMRRRGQRDYEVIIITMDSNTFSIACQDAVDKIFSWDQWIDFIRALSLRRYD